MVFDAEKDILRKKIGKTQSYLNYFFVSGMHSKIMRIAPFKCATHFVS